MATKKKTGKVLRFNDSDNLLTVSDLLDYENVQLERLEIPELQKNGKPGVVFLKTLSAGDVLEFVSVKEGQTEADRHQNVLHMMVKAVVSKDGKRLFTNQSADELGKVSFAVFNRIVNAINKMSGIGTKTGPEGMVEVAGKG